MIKPSYDLHLHPRKTNLYYTKFCINKHTSWALFSHLQGHLCYRVPSKTRSIGGYVGCVLCWRSWCLWCPSNPKLSVDPLHWCFHKVVVRFWRTWKDNTILWQKFLKHHESKLTGSALHHPHWPPNIEKAFTASRKGHLVKIHHAQAICSSSVNNKKRNCISTAWHVIFYISRCQQTVSCLPFHHFGVFFS